MVIGVRVRPMSAKELKRGSTDVLEVKDASKVFAYDPDDKMGGLDYLRLDKTKDKAYQFDHAFGAESTSKDVYERCVRRVVKAVVEGFHGSCFAYGATGSGKTYTMMGAPEAPGVMPLAVSDLFNLVADDDDSTWRFGLTYVEIYNERVKDLLNPESKTDLEVREDAKKGTHIQGAVEVGVSSLQEIMEHMSRGSLHRTTEATNCNEVSSRSHAVLQVVVQAVQRYGEGGGQTRRVSKLSLIDLAGSERAYKTDNRGQRLMEGRNINRSLLSLANCINALADRTKKDLKHVPYRDSKLTRLLRDSLSGTSVSSMLCAVSPASDQFEETLNTLKCCLHPRFHRSPSTTTPRHVPCAPAALRYANRAKQMAPPSIPMRQVQNYNKVDEQVEVLKQLKESLVHLTRNLSSPDRTAMKPQDDDGRRGRRERHPSPPPPTQQNAQGKSRAPTPAAPAPAAPLAVDVGATPPKAAAPLGAGLGMEGSVMAVAAACESGNASMADVHHALASLIEREPEARANPSVQAAYQALDNMEAEEVESISAECALLWREQQGLLTDLASAQSEAKIAHLKLAWVEASGEGDTGAPMVEKEKRALRQRMRVEEETAARLRSDLAENRQSLRQLQEEIPQRLVSSQRLSQLRLVMKHHQAAADAVRFKQQARGKVALVKELLETWHPGIPQPLHDELRHLFDLSVPADSTPSAEAAPRTPPAAAVDDSSFTARGGADVLTIEEQGDDEEGPYLLSQDGTVTPWRTLGALAMRAAQEAEGEDTSKIVGEVFRRATEELKNARTRRLGLMRFVDEVASPKAARSLAVRAENCAASPAGATSLPPADEGSAANVPRRAIVEDEGFNAATSKLSQDERFRDGLTREQRMGGDKLGIGSKGEALAVSYKDDPLMQSYYPSLPAWMAGDPPAADGAEDGSERPKQVSRSGYNSQILEALRLGASLENGGEEAPAAAPSARTSTSGIPRPGARAASAPRTRPERAERSRPQTGGDNPGYQAQSPRATPGRNPQVRASRPHTAASGSDGRVPEGRRPPRLSSGMPQQQQQ